ncbi:hypothetical protein PR048_028114 [Dryococelus australis]|uniref:Uncharacterized protein n=1 Tax=Dryococelus australis TaxID=614101 RepID=A0ABQ9GIE6_9NEOP|nr:hypothetical protein PR048_028114 [Dryococelus australis]
MKSLPHEVVEKTSPGISLHPMKGRRAVFTKTSLLVVSQHLAGSQKGKTMISDLGRGGGRGGEKRRCCLSHSLPASTLQLLRGKEKKKKKYVTGFDSRRGRSLGLVNRAGRCRWSAGFLGDFPFPQSLRSSAAPCSPRFTHVGSQDHDGVRKREIPDKTRRPAASSGNCDNPGVSGRGLNPMSMGRRRLQNARAGEAGKFANQRGIEPDSPLWWEAHSLTTAPLRPPHPPHTQKKMQIAQDRCGRIELRMEQRQSGGVGKREISEKTHRPTASSGMIPSYENPGVTWAGIEPGSHL